MTSLKFYHRWWKKRVDRTVRTDRSSGRSVDGNKKNSISDPFTNRLISLLTPITPQSIWMVSHNAFLHRYQTWR